MLYGQFANHNIEQCRNCHKSVCDNQNENIKKIERMRNK